MEILLFLAGLIASSFGFIVSQQYAAANKKVEQFEKLIALLQTSIIEIALCCDSLKKVEAFHTRHRNPFTTDSVELCLTRVETESIALLRQKLMDFSESVESASEIASCIHIYRIINTGLDELDGMALRAKRLNNPTWQNHFYENRRRIDANIESVFSKASQAQSNLQLLINKTVDGRKRFLNKHPFGSLIGENSNYWTD